MNGRAGTSCSRIGRRRPSGGNCYRRRQRPPLETTARATKDTASKAGRAIVGSTPEKVKDVAGSAVDAALVPTVQSLVHLLELLNDWVVE